MKAAGQIASLVAAAMLGAWGSTATDYPPAEFEIGTDRPNKGPLRVPRAGIL